MWNLLDAFYLVWLTNVHLKLMVFVLRIYGGYLGIVFEISIGIQSLTWKINSLQLRSGLWLWLAGD
jgi:hypothetical protein